MTTFVPADQAVRDEIERALDRNLCVEAGAGTGKTTVLVARIVEILRSGTATVDQIAVITFTEKAAAELAGRVRERLEMARDSSREPEERQRLGEAIRGLNRAGIETIHAFASAILRERPVEAGLDPGFDVLDTLGAELSFDEAFRDWLGRVLRDDSDALWRALNLGFEIAHLREAAMALHRHRALLPLAAEPIGISADAVLDELFGKVEELELLLGSCHNEDDHGAREIKRIIETFERYRSSRGSRDALERAMARAIKFGPKGTQKNWGKAAHERQKDICREINARLEEFRRDLRGDVLLGVLPLVEQFVRDYEEQRRRAGKADFDDLLIWARNLLRDDLAVRAYFQRRFRCLLVDEFQDTDPLQVEIVLYLTSDGQHDRDWRKLRPVPGKLFVVGDPKQSIYRFRRADISIYKWVKHQVLADGQRTIAQNFRSIDRVIAWVNGVFAQVITPADGIQPDYVPLHATPVNLTAPEAPVVLLFGDGEATTADEMRRQEARLLAALIQQAVIDQGWLVRDPESKEARPARWRDIAILLPRRTGIEHYEDALAEAGIPYRHEGGRAFFDRQEVRELVSCLRVIDDPTDRLSLVAALRSGAFGCSDDEIFRFVDGGGQLDIRVTPPPGQPAVTEALETLRGLAESRRRLSLSELLDRVLAQTHLVEYALTLPQGDQAAANLLKVIDQARAYGRARGGGLRSFVRWLATSGSGQADEADAAVAEMSDDVIRLLTIHSAKGLEFPIVALANLNGDQQRSRGTVAIPDPAGQRLHLKIGSSTESFATPGFDEADELEKQHGAAEDARLLYVAATRARDHLIVPVIPPPNKVKGMLSILHPFLNCPDWQPHDTDIDGLGPVVRYCDPSMLPLNRSSVRLLAEDVVGEQQIDKISSQFVEWQARRADLIERASSAIGLAGIESDSEWDQVDALVNGGEEFGQTDDQPDHRTALDRLLHATLRRLALANPAGLERTAAAAARWAGKPELASEVTELARRCLDLPSVARALASGDYRQNVMLAIELPDGNLAEGLIDLLVLEGDGLVVIDFRLNAAGADERQAAVLAYPTSRATGLPIHSVIIALASEGEERSFEVDAQLIAKGAAQMIARARAQAESAFGSGQRN